MTAPAETFILRTTLTSPFGRKVLMAAHVLQLADRITVVSADYADPADSLRRQNPLGKIPCLVRADGSTVYDSSVILEFLQEVAGSSALLPREGMARVQALTATRLADGIIDAGALIIYEERYHPEGQRSSTWIEHQRGKMQRAVDAFEANPPDPQVSDAVTISLACALGFLDKRKPLPWRADHPRLVAWFDAFQAREPAFAQTQAPAGL